MRAALSWALFGVGHAIWWCFDRDWCGGMHWPIYKTYNAFMTWSSKVQGDGDNGPWSSLAETSEAATTPAKPLG